MMMKFANDSSRANIDNKATTIVMRNFLRKCYGMRSETKVILPFSEWTSLDLEGAGIYHIKTMQSIKPAEISTWAPTSLMVAHSRPG